MGELSEWADVIGAVFNGIIAVLAGIVLPWVRSIHSEMQKNNETLRVLTRRVNRHGYRIKRLETRHTDQK